MHRASFNRMYIILRPVEGQAAGFARLEAMGGRSRLHVQASRLPRGPIRAMLMAGEMHTTAILDLGAMHPMPGRQWALSRDDLALHRGYHTLILASDWPEPKVLLYGCLGHSPCTLWQMQEAVQHYLAVPAGCPAKEEPLRPSVLMLRQRDFT